MNNIRNWAARQLQPPYAELPVEDDPYEESKEENDQSDLLSNGASSSLSTSVLPSSSSDFSHARPTTAASTALTIILFVPLLLLQLLRRTLRLQAVWVAAYEQLGFFQVLVPTFCQPGESRPKLHPSAWLDGLRGLAALLVVCHHASLLWFSPAIHRGYASSEDGPHYFIQLPFVRMLVSGRPQVAIFFVVSGYALSYKPLRLSRMGRHHEASDAVASAAFRRHPRLFLMPVVISFLAALMTHWNLYGTEGWEGVAAATRQPSRPELLREQLWDWLLNVRRLMDPLAHNLQRGRTFSYDINLWTLPIEFDCSLVVFLAQAAFNRLRPRVRMLMLLGMAVYAHTYYHWEVFLFLSGMLICDLHFHLDGTSVRAATSPAPEPATTLAPPSPTASLAARRSRCSRNLLGFTTFAAALYVLSLPDYADGWADTPGYRTLFRLVSERYASLGQFESYWLPPAAVLLVFAIDRTPALQRIFTTSFAQYFGTISYSLYLVHGPLLWTLGHWLVRQTTARTGTDTDAHYGLGISLCILVFWPVMIALADLATRVLDKRAVNTSRLMYEWATKDPDAGLPRP